MASSTLYEKLLVGTFPSVLQELKIDKLAKHCTKYKKKCQCMINIIS